MVPSVETMEQQHITERLQKLEQAQIKLQFEKDRILTDIQLCKSK